jgi:hypothetical protein
LAISLGWHATEHNPLAVVIADLGKEDLKRPHLVFPHRSHVTAVDGKRDPLGSAR